jgi:hypothetical protein
MCNMRCDKSDQYNKFTSAFLRRVSAGGARTVGCARQIMTSAQRRADYLMNIILFVLGCSVSAIIHVD